ncbi:hypothetical protein C5167_024225 [Papaver somniferum]|uniref:Uncharacterized protein n=1 Tax=Papaver somniferum TaxID=3469 RepID=A0A4Y7JN05_PAPSO|nr:uncharacterized protein LOC113277972 [Papaver somniferum]RZC62473.1 hypothetical protein C5167_024225 [Papaver somniferum]
MASNKIHPLRQSAMEAGNPGKYYINPSEKLISKASHWKFVEHEDGIELIFNEAAFEGVLLFGKRYNNQAIGDYENKDDECSFIMNTDYLDARKIDYELMGDISKFYIPKIKVGEN